MFSGSHKALLSTVAISKIQHQDKLILIFKNT